MKKLKRKDLEENYMFEYLTDFNNKFPGAMYFLATVITSILTSIITVLLIKLF